MSVNVFEDGELKMIAGNAQGILVKGEKLNSSYKPILTNVPANTANQFGMAVSYDSYQFLLNFPFDNVYGWIFDDIIGLCNYCFDITNTARGEIIEVNFVPYCKDANGVFRQIGIKNVIYWYNSGFVRATDFETIPEKDDISFVIITVAKNSANGRTLFHTKPKPDTFNPNINYYYIQ